MIRLPDFLGVYNFFSLKQLPLCPSFTWFHVTLCPHERHDGVQFCVVKNMACGASGTAGSRCSYYVIRNLSSTISWLCFPLCWLHSQWSLHIAWPLAALGLYPASGQRSLLSRKFQQQWIRLGYVFILNKSDQENGISHWPILGHVLIPVSLINVQ